MASSRNLCNFFAKTAIAIVVFLFSGCASHLYVKSTPEKAKVELISLHNSASSPLGETPLLLDKDAVSSIQVTGPYLIRISKEGFQPREILLASLSGLEAEFNVELQTGISAQASNELINGLFEAQALAQKGQRQACLDRLDELQKKHPNVAAIYEIRGSVHLLQGEYSQAQSELTKALTLDPENHELRVLADSAASHSGQPARLPASETPKKETQSP